MNPNVSDQPREECSDVRLKNCDWQVSGNSEQEIMPRPYEGVPLGMRRIRPEYLDSDRSDQSVGEDVQLRETPDEEDDDEDERDKDNEENETDEEDDENGYSE